MRKTGIFLLLAAVFVMFTVQNAYAWGRKKTTVPEKKQVEVKVIAEKKVIKKKAVEIPVQKKVADETSAKVDVPSSKSAKKALRKKMRARLDNTSWNAEIFPIAGGGKVQKDSLIFSDNKFHSEQFSMKGFGTTNYTLTIKDDGMIIWETMQGADDGQVIFWRGEINQDMTEMRGVLSQQKSPEESESFTFISKEKMPVKK